MENQVLQEVEISDARSFVFQNLADSRVQALKSLASMLLNELELLESLTAKADGLAKIQNLSLCKEVATLECEMIRTALLETHGNQRKAAGLLGVKASTLCEKMKRYGINSRGFGYKAISADR